MEPLFSLDSRLRELSRRPFPSSESPFFVEDEVAPQAPPLINSRLLHRHHQHLHHLHPQLPPNHSSVPTWLAHNEPMGLIQEHARPSENCQILSFGISPTSQVLGYGDAPSPPLPRNGTIFNRQLMGHSPGEQIVAPSSYDPGKGTARTGHGQEGYHHNSNPNPAVMMASEDPLCMSAGTTNVAHGAHWRISPAIFSQGVGHHHSGTAPSSNSPVMDAPSRPSYYPITNDHAGQRYSNNSEPCMIYPGLVSNPSQDHQGDQFMGCLDYITDNFRPNEQINEDEMRNSSSWGGKPPHFMP